MIATHPLTDLGDAIEASAVRLRLIARWPATPTLTFVERDSAAWAAAWASLALLDDLDDAYDPETGENWQYMGHLSTAGAAPSYVQFRHRCHPRTRQRIYLTLPAIFHDDNR